MPKLEYFIVAESVAVDQSTNRISVFHILEELRLIKNPPPDLRLPVPQVTAVSCWLNDDADRDKQFQVSLRLRAPGEEIGETIGEISFAGEMRRQRTLQTILGFRAPKPSVGELTFEICLDGQPKAHHTVTVSESSLELAPEAKQLSDQHLNKEN